MKRCGLFVFCCVLFVAFAFSINAQAQPAEAQKHVAAAKALAYEPGHDYTGSFETICVEPRPAAPRGGGGGGQRADGAQVGRRIPPREQWYTPPNKLFDNMYYVGSDNNSVYA